MSNIFPIDFEEKLTMAQDDYILFSDSEDGNKIKKAQYKNLKWEPWTPWEDGSAATITVGSTTTLPSWSSATVTNTWTSSAAVLDFGIPAWPKWEDWADGNDWAAATITAWTTTTLPAWSSATVTNSWTSSAAVFNFGIPQWATWATWNWIASITSSKSWKITTVTITETNSTVDTFQISDWADWQWSWDVIWPASSVDWDVVVFDWATWKLIKDWSIALSTLSAWASAWATAVQPWDIGTAAACNTWTGSWNVPVLDSNWKLDKTTLPWVALTDTFTVSTSSDLTSLSSAEQWDLAIATSENKTYVLSADPYSTAANWKEILSPTGWVTSVNSQTWAVTLDADDISDSTTTNKFVTASDKTTWSGKQDALTLPATPTQWNLVTWWANNKSLVDWWAIPTGVPSWWNNGDVLTNVSWTPTWQAPSGWDVMVSSQTGNILTSWMKIWAWLETDYQNLGSYDQNTVYLTI